jgi:hypothetical protein
MRGVIAVLLACACAIAISGRTPSNAQPAPDLDRARTLYTAAEQAMTEARFEDAVRDYRAAYDLSKDPALLYKLGGAHQKAGACRPAVAFFVAYLRLGKPSPDFFALTRERIRQCNYDPDALPPNLEDATGLGAGSGSAVGSGSGSAVGSGSGSADPLAGSADPAAGAGSGSAIAPVRGRHRAAWLLVGGAIAAATVGAVLAYSADAAENDLDDLYVGLGGNPPPFNDTTRQRFDALVDEGRRYQTLSWVSFSLAGVLGGLAAWRFVTAKPARAVEITPTVTPSGAGVSAGFRF